MGTPQKSEKPLPPTQPEEQKKGATTPPSPPEEELRATITGLHQNDGTIVITISEDHLLARADFYPPIGDGNPLTPEYIAAMLEKLSITYGIRWDAIQEAALECNLNRKIIKDVLIAQGDSPAEEVLPYFDLDSRFKSSAPTYREEGGRVDYRAISHFFVVKKGEYIAHYREKVPGKEGKDIHGKTIPMPIRKMDSIVAGKNTKQTTDGIVATVDGRLFLNGNEVTVEEVLALKGNVGYGTGHIIFPGDVVLEGEVSDGFKVYAGGSITAKQTLDATDVVAKKDLVVAGGIIGRGNGIVKVGGTVRARFIQNCYLLSRGTVWVSGAIVNSRIYSMERIDLGDKGKIIGGELYAIHGIRAESIGREGGRVTRIHCGIDFISQQELDKHNESLRILAGKINKIQNLLKNPEIPGEQKKRFALYLKKLQEEQVKLQNRIVELLPKINANEQAVIEIHGSVAEGTIIEICHVALFIEKPLKKVRFRLNKQEGKLIHEPLKDR
ncbi:MAG: FapA family protein [Treponemataceae bacterium]|nr:FapA family protein [Treponemataceae bacterium]